MIFGQKVMYKGLLEPKELPVRGGNLKPVCKGAKAASGKQGRVGMRRVPRVAVGLLQAGRGCCQVGTMRPLRLGDAVVKRLG